MWLQCHDNEGWKTHKYEILNRMRSNRLQINANKTLPIWCAALRRFWLLRLESVSRSSCRPTRLQFITSESEMMPICRWEPMLPRQRRDDLLQVAAVISDSDAGSVARVVKTRLWQCDVGRHSSVSSVQSAQRHSEDHRRSTPLGEHLHDAASLHWVCYYLLLDIIFTVSSKWQLWFFAFFKVWLLATFPLTSFGLLIYHLVDVYSRLNQHSHRLASESHYRRRTCISGQQAVERSSWRTHLNTVTTRLRRFCFTLIIII